MNGLQVESTVLFSYGTNADAPGAVTNFLVTPGAAGALNATITWTNPSVTFGGDPLTELDFIYIEQNGDLIHTVTNPTIGGAGTHPVTVTAAGNYNYKIFGENDEGEGAAVSMTVWIGADMPGAPTGATGQA